MEETKKLVQFAMKTAYQDLPDATIAAAKKSMLDCLGVTFAGSVEPVGKLIRDFAGKMGCAPEAVVIAGGFRTSVPNAALANGTMAHALDYDDLCNFLKGHPTAVILPTLLAVGEQVKASGTEIIAAFILGLEVAGRVCDAMGPDYPDNLGWHPTAPLGTIASAIAAARLMKLSAEQAAIAIGIAASQAAGLRQNFGTMTKPFHVGNAQRAGITSAMMAQEGFTAATDVLEGHAGFVHAFSGGRDYDVSRMLDNLGKTYKLISPGIALKRYPCCGSNHGALNALYAIMDKHDIKPEKVAAVDVVVPFEPPRSLIYDNPQTGLQGKFSIQYSISAALVDRKLALKTFTTEQVQRLELRKLLPKVKMFRDPGAAGKPSFQDEKYVVTVRMDSGEEYSASAETPFTAELDTMTRKDVIDKFRDCTSLVLAEKQIDRAIEIMENLEKAKNITELADIIVQEKG
ncbi:MmgE/PrpD family protein [Chloroflexota bacterium]